MRWLMLLLMWPTFASATCQDVTFEGLSLTQCEVDPSQQRLQLFLNNSDGTPLGSFAAVENTLPQTQTLGFAMNAGMYHPDRSPVGHYVENGVEVQRLIPNAGPGNFGLLPNGVLCLRSTRADVIETLTFRDRKPTCHSATQSGPMLVIDGALHPRFLPDSTSRHIRNGVGTSADGKRAVFVISNDRVTFHEFGRFFRDALGLPQALYFDGKVSRLYSPGLNRRDLGFPLGPMIGTVIPAN